ncbi:MAG: penicillin-binding protein activator [Candidatus Woesearchaeota archaeon]|nr:penicillin-binding protein activator [Candidatus Woesearchaeota archaeon]
MNTTNKIFRNLFAIAAVLLIFSACSTNTSTGAVTAEKETISLGAILFLTNNEFISVAEAIQQGIDIGVAEINERGGLLGKELRIIYEDDEFSVPKSVTAGQKILETDNVVAAITVFAPQAKAVGPLFERKKIPLLLVGDSNKEIEDVGRYTFSIGYSTEYSGKKMAQHIWNSGARTTAILMNFDDWSQLIGASFKQEFTQLGGSVVVEEFVDFANTDFRTTLLKARNADVIYAPLVAQQAVFLKQAREIGYTGLIAGGNSLTPDILQAAGTASEGIFLTTIPEYANSQSLALKEKYLQKYGKEPELFVWTVTGYDGIQVLAHAIEVGQSTNSEAITQALYATKDFLGTSGVITMNELGSAPKKEKLYRVQNGDFILIEGFE